MIGGKYDESVEEVEEAACKMKKGKKPCPEDTADLKKLAGI